VLASQFHPGTNTALGKDFTLFSHTEGIVIFEKKKDRALVRRRSRWQRQGLIAAAPPPNSTSISGLAWIESQCDNRHRAPQVHVYPMDHVKAQAAIKATHTKQPAEGQLSRRQRRLEAWKGKARKNAAAAAPAAPVAA
jgi:hypothetical protein